MSEMFRLPTSTQDLGGVLATGFALYRDSLRLTAPLALTAQVVSSLPLIASTGTRAAPPSALPAGGDLLLALLCAVLGLVPWTAMSARCWAHAYGQEMGLTAALRRGLGLLPRMLGATLLYCLVVTLGLALLLLPGLYLGVTLMLYPLVLLAEDRAVLPGLARSHALVRGHWWRASMAISAPTAVILAIVLLSQAPPLLAALQVDVGAQGAPVVSFLLAAASLLLYALTVPLLAAMLIALYHDLLLAHGTRTHDTRMLN